MARQTSEDNSSNAIHQQKTAAPRYFCRVKYSKTRSYVIHIKNKKTFPKLSLHITVVLPITKQKHRDTSNTQFYEVR